MYEISSMSVRVYISNIILSMAGESPIQCGFPWSHDTAAVVLASLAQREGKFKKKKTVGIYLN